MFLKVIKIVSQSLLYYNYCYKLTIHQEKIMRQTSFMLLTFVLFKLPVLDDPPTMNTLALLPFQLFEL